MNWLAHLRLAPERPLLRIGNLCGDFVRGVAVADLHPELQRGVLQHRAVDRFVDAHVVVRRSRERLGPEWRRWAGVLVDVFYDHFLARDWEQHGDGRPLPEFVGEVHADLVANVALLPPRLQAALPMMQRQGWLVGYREVEGIDLVLRRMARRLKRESPLGDGARALVAHYGALESDFAAFWPDLERFARAASDR
jgi:acyl carrier protein phosphodiesterase